MQRLLVVCVLGMVVAGLWGVGSAGATPPGRDGRISVAVFGQRGGINIAVMNRDGSNLHLVTNNPKASSLASSWSPNGRMLALDVFPPSGGGEIWVMRADGTHKRMLVGKPGAIPSVFDDSPAWSPNGRWILFVHAGGSGHEELRAVRPDGSGGHLVLSIPGQNLEYPAFSPDGRRIVFTDQISFGSASRLETAWSDGSHVKPIPNTLRLEAFTDSWSPNGRWIAFSNNQFKGASSVFAIRPDGSGLHRITRPGRHAYNDLGPVWSPQGDQLAFSRSPCPGNPTNGCPFDQVAIWVIGADSSHPHAITHNPKINYLNADWGRKG